MNDVEMVIAGYLAISRSSLHFSEPAWFDLAEEEAEWERVCAAAGILCGRRPGRAECATG